MATRKQRKRTVKERRHEYETVWVDSEGNDLEDPPDDAPAPARARRSDSKSTTQQKRPAQRVSSRAATKTPLPPSWRRAGRRAFLVAAALCVFVYISNSKVTGAARIIGAVEIGGLYGLLFTPLMYYLDKFAYARWQKKTAERPTKR